MQEQRQKHKHKDIALQFRAHKHKKDSDNKHPGNNSDLGMQPPMCKQVNTQETTIQG